MKRILTLVAACAISFSAAAYACDGKDEQPTTTSATQDKQPKKDTKKKDDKDKKAPPVQS